MCLLYPFTTDSEGITTHPFGQPIKFKFLRNPEPKEIEILQKVSVSKNLNLTNTKTSSDGPNQAKNLDHIVPTIIFDNSLSLLQSHRLSSHHIACKGICSMTSHDFNKYVSKINHFVNTWQAEKQKSFYNSPTSKWKMASSSRNKGKVPVQGSSQRHEGTSAGTEPREVTSLLEHVPLQITFSGGNMNITLHEVLSRNYQFTNGVYTGLPPSIKIVLDNLQRAFTQNNNRLFQRTLRALEL